VIEIILKPVILGMAHGTIGRIALGFMIGGRIIGGLMAPNTGQWGGCKVPFVTLRTLNNIFVRTF
jgi:hypothetical protein